MCTPKDVVQSLVTHAYLCGQGGFAQILKGTAYDEVLVHLIISVYTHEGLALQTICVIALHGGADGGAGIYDTLVNDGNTAVVVVYDVVRVLHQCYSACSYYHRTRCYVVCSEVYLVGGRAFVLTRQQELVLLGHLLGCGLGGVV